jgi:hypothetical protein
MSYPPPGSRNLAELQPRGPMRRRVRYLPPGFWKRDISDDCVKVPTGEPGTYALVERVGPLAWLRKWWSIMAEKYGGPAWEAEEVSGER